MPAWCGPATPSRPVQREGNRPRSRLARRATGDQHRQLPDDVDPLLGEQPVDEQPAAPVEVAGHPDLGEASTPRQLVLGEPDGGRRGMPDDTIGL